MSGDCLDDDLVAEYLTGAPPDQARARVELHLDACPDCLALVCEAARHSAADPGPTLPAPDLAPALAALPAGHVVGRYTLLEMIGRGGMGAVYAAHDPKLDRRIAVKVVRADRRQSPRAHERMAREARAMARLAHPHVVQVYDTGEVEGGVFIAMELIDGATLGDWLRERERSWVEVVEAFLAAAQGLAAAHAAGIVHRDFKPDNVLIDAAGRVVVTDFGLAAESKDAAPTVTVDPLTETLPDSSLTHPGAVLGTPRYMSPEQLEAREVDALSDQFSFGVALYEALYGTRPFEGDSLEELRSAVVAGRARRPSGPRAARVPRRLEAVVMRALRADRLERFPGMTP